MNYLNIEEIQEIPETEFKNKTYTMVMKPFVGNSNLSFKADLNSLSSFYLQTEDLTNVENAILKFRTDIEKTFTGFETEDYFSENGYMLKEDADYMRKKLLTKPVLETLLGNYLKKEQLSVDIKEVEENSYSLVNSYIASMVSPAATVKTSVAEINAMDEAVSDMGSTTPST